MISWNLIISNYLLRASHHYPWIYLGSIKWIGSLGRKLISSSTVESGLSRIKR